jgi:homopolymeric O-antigen transport system permease protein
MNYLNIGLIAEFVKRDFTDKFAGSVLGSLWTFILPLVNIAIYTIIFSRFMGARLAGAEGRYAYSIYLVAAIIPWTAFAATISRSATVFLDKKHILTKINLPLASMPLYIALSETVSLLISLGLFYLFLLLIGQQLSVYHLLVPFILLVQQLFAFAIGLILAVLTVFVRDLREMVGVLLQVWFWFTPIVYVKEILPEWVRQVMVFNPAFVIVDSFQTIFLHNRLPSMDHLLALTVVTFLLLSLAYLVFTRLEADVRDFL